MTTAQVKSKNPRRIAAGQRNGLKRRPWNEADRLRLSRQCHERRPWLASTGPRTGQGKQRSARNGHGRCPDPNSLRQLRADRAAVNRMRRQMAPVHDAIQAARVQRAGGAA